MSISDLDGPDQMQLVWGMDMSAANSYGIITVGTSLTAPLLCRMTPIWWGVVWLILTEMTSWMCWLPITTGAVQDGGRLRHWLDYEQDGRVKGWTPYRTLTEISVYQIPYRAA